MQIAIFAKRQTSNDGRPYVKYLSRLTKKDGTELTAVVKFRDPCPKPDPDICPINIKFDKGDANFSTKNRVNEDTAEIITAHTLWVTKWEIGAPYVDKSLDEFVD